MYLCCVKQFSKLYICTFTSVLSLLYALVWKNSYAEIIWTIGLSATVVSLGKKLHSHCLSHPAVKPGTHIVWSGHSWKAALVADVVIPVETTKKIVDHLEFD